MNNSNTQKTHKFRAFMKKYAYTFILILGAVSAITLLVISRRVSRTGQEAIIDESLIVDENAIVVENSQQEEIPVPTEEVEIIETSTKTEVQFQNPTSASVVIRDYSDEEFINYVSLGYYAVHKAVDFSGEAGTEVFSVAKGKVLSVETTSNLGTTVVIEHENGFKSLYSSLDSNVEVKAGDSVKMGQQIGTMSNSMLDEAELGVHLHFALYKDGALVDPNLYLTLSNK